MSNQCNAWATVIRSTEPVSIPEFSAGAWRNSTFSIARAAAICVALASVATT
jgi:hypothetical protein